MLSKDLGFLDCVFFEQTEMHRMYVQSSLAVKTSLAEIFHFKSVKMVCRSLQILDPVLRKKKLE